MAVDTHHWQNRPVFVTGASGFLGGWLTAQLLSRGSNLTCLIHDWNSQSQLIRSGMIGKVKVVRGDVRDRALIEQVLAGHGIKSVFHLAGRANVAEASRNPLPVFESNIQGTWNLLEACRSAPSVQAIVMVSSDKAYGEHEALPYTEDCALQGRNPYDVSKSCADLIAQSYAASYRMPVAITRCGNFFGGGDLNWHRIVPGTIRSILSGQDPVIRSDGYYVRDYLYVEDAASAHMLLAEHLAVNPEVRGLAFNFSNEKPITVVELVNLILAEMGSSLHPDIQNRAAHEIRRQHLSAERARSMLNWRPSFTMQEGLRRTIRWYKDFLS